MDWFKWFAAINKVLNIFFIKFKRSYRMRKEEQGQSFHFILIITSVKMKVKFPCKMAIEQAGHALTKEVPPNEQGKFIFNQQVRLREESEKMFAELNVSLVTEKGARYISGMIKLYHNELIRSEAERLVVTLSKCLDSDAICEIKVDKVIREGTQRKRTLTTIPERNQKANNRQNDQVNPVLDFKSPPRADLAIGNSQTKSQAHFPVTTNMRFRKEDSQVRSKEYGGMLGQATNAKRYGNASPKSKARPVINSKNKYQPFQFANQLQRDKLIQAEVYKDNYQKLKHKYLRETQNSKNELSRRMMLQNNENNYKLEIVRLKIRNDELEKALTQKNNRLKEYSNSLAALQGRDSEINFMREDMANKEHSMQIMQETIITLSRENDELRAANKDIAFKLQEKIIMLQSQIDNNNAHSLNKQHELQRQIKILNETLQFKDSEMNRKNQTLEKQKRNVYQLQRALQNKLFQYDSLLQNQRNNCKQKIDEFKNKIQQTNQSFGKLTIEKSELLAEVDKLKGLLLKGEYEFKLYQQQMNNLRTELQQIKPIRDKYNEVFKELRIITQQKISIQKNHQKFMHSKESTLEEMSSQYRKEIDYQKRSVKDLQERNKSLSSKFIEAEGNLQITKGSLDKLKRNHDSLNKEYTQLKERQKGLKKNLKLKEEQCEDIKKEVNRLKQKNQTIFQSMKSEMSKVRQDLSKTKIELQSQEIKNQQLTETNSQITMELARLKMTQQFSEEKYDKLMASAQQKYSQFQKIIKEHQGVIQLLQQKIRAQKGNQKEYYSKIQKCDYEVNLVAERNDKVLKEIRTVQQRNKQLQINLKNKQAELAEAVKNITQLQFQLNDSHQKTAQIKEQLQFTKNQLEKGKKMIEILQRDLDKSKSEILLYSQRLTDKQRQLQQKIQQIKRDKQTISTLESKSTTVKKQYDRFKQSVHEALNSSFTQIIHSFQKQDNSRISTIPSIEFSHGNSSQKRQLGLGDLSNDLVAMISMAGKENKGQITKLTERNRQLQRDIEIVKSEMERSAESSKRHIQQKSNYIEQLQDQLRSIRNDKGESQVHYQMQMAELQDHLKQYQKQCQILINNKNQLQFSLSSFKVQAEKMADQFEKKITNLKRERLQYQQKLEYQYHSTEIVQKKVHELQVQLMNVNSVLMLEKQTLYKKQLKVQELQEQRQKLAKDSQSFKKQVKQLQEKYSQLQIHYLTVSEMKSKYQSMLNEEQNKLKDVRTFNNSILKEKEEIIKKELQKNIEISSLENQITELRHSITQEENIKNKYKSDYEEIKETNKRITHQIKELQTSISFEKTKYSQIREKLREKEQQLTETRQETQLLKKKIEETATRHKNALEQLKQENQTISRQLQSNVSQSNETIRTLQAQLSKTTTQLQNAREEMGELQQSIFVERENNQSMQDSINKLKMELQDTKKKIEEMQQTYEQLLQQNREKDETMFEMGGKIYEYQGRMREMQEQKQRQIEQINNNLNVKYDEDYQQIYQKIEFIQKQKEYFKDKYQEKEEIISRKNQELKHKQIEEMELKKAYEEKIKKLEDQKLTIFTDKNKEVSKILEENKAQFQTLRLKDTEIRKIVHELEISRTTIQKQQAKIKEMLNEKSNQVKVYQTEIQNLRKRELTFKSYKDLIRTNQWNCERQVRKHIQNFIKKILQIGEKEVRNENVISLIKGLQQGLLLAIVTISKD